MKVNFIQWKLSGNKKQYEYYALYLCIMEIFFESIVIILVPIPNFLTKN